MNHVAFLLSLHPMRKKNISGFFLVVLFLSLTSCGKFSKLQKSGTDEQKYEAALKYYKAGDYYHAGLLFEELGPLLKGGAESELAEFYNAYCQFYQGDYTSSQYLFKKFFDTYARSEHAQEAFYMHAFSLYKGSSPYNLDQTSTMTAITSMQDFINFYPDSPFKDECTKYILELRTRLELKAYEKAKLYYKISDFQLPSLKSSVISIDNFNKDFPDSKFNEELAYLKVDAQHKLATSSFVEKQKERYEHVVKFYHAFVDKYPESKYVREAERMFSDSQEKLVALDKYEKERREYLKRLAEQKDNKPAKVTTSPRNER